MSEKFKNQLPEACPWDGCENPMGQNVYRLITAAMPSSEDFIPLYDLKPANRKSYERNERSHCMSLGLSMLSTKEAAENLLKHSRMKNKMSGHVQLYLDQESCKVSIPDNKNHLTCWFYSLIEPLELIVEENEP